ncbi:hypothetical protein C8F01DRAFT_325430 [Mycena amicta]|nr:hypothetical protein C8F01DRAFT_325430 [Mycena amicta]
MSKRAVDQGGIRSLHRVKTGHSSAVSRRVFIRHFSLRPPPQLQTASADALDTLQPLHLTLDTQPLTSIPFLSSNPPWLQPPNARVAQALAWTAPTIRPIHQSPVLVGATTATAVTGSVRATPITGNSNNVRTAQRTQWRPPRTNDEGRRPPRTDGPPIRNPPLPSADNNTRRRGAKFNAGLTSNDSNAPANRYSHFKPKPAESDDLSSRLASALGTAPYPDCPICFSAVHPAQPTWSCSPSIAVLDAPQYCWTTFHLKCVRAWAQKSVKELADAWAARGEPERGGEWRCPGCQSRRKTVPGGYRCFCGAQASPAPARISTPHSCASPCSRKRTGCDHPCPLLCHPGPCPPCRVTTELQCGCPRGQVLALRCGEANVSCGAVCERTLNCGVHKCTRDCHTDSCDPCAERVQARCYCGKDQKEDTCGAGEPANCSLSGNESWTGTFACPSTCDRPFACGTHRCSKPCHPEDGPPAPCPRDPKRVLTCPCGHVPIGVIRTAATSFPARLSCSDPIPTCTSTCSKVLSCGHACAARCHEGDCPPCTEKVVHPCRCGASSKSLRCSEINSSYGETEILCEKACPALRACGRHRCLRVCCPLASVAALQQKAKGKKRAVAAHGHDETGVGEEPGGLHECDLVCGKMLGCGSHRCERRDHKGPCGDCLMSSFEELICYCGLTVLDPPIPCGTVIQCPHPCSRPLPACGHPRTPHSCHFDAVACPPCPFLTSKKCMCGKKTVGNVRCSQEKVGCGAVCGKVLACGAHTCERVCHAPEGEGDDGGCGPCSAPCGKPRRLCHPAQHPCTAPCHAPSACDESTPCTAVITVSCACLRIRQQLQCGKSLANPAGRREQQIKCTNECLVAKRNARLAEALGITPESREKFGEVVWNDEIKAFARANARFVAVVEKAFAEFVASEKKTQVLPHMPPERRKFVHDVASVYRMDTQMVDQEPHRSVQLIRRYDTRVPSPLLSTLFGGGASTAHHAGGGLGKLTDLRAGGSWRANPGGQKVDANANAKVASTQPRGWGVQTAVSRGSTAASTSSVLPMTTSSVPSAPSRPPGIPIPTPVAVSTPPGPPQTPTDVPEDWEDDA